MGAFLLCIVDFFVSMKLKGTSVIQWSFQLSCVVRQHIKCKADSSIELFYQRNGEKIVKSLEVKMTSPSVE